MHEPNDFTMPNSTVVGYVLMLTKPLGTQVAFSAHSRAILRRGSKDEINILVSMNVTQEVTFNMVALSTIAAVLMYTCNSEGATGITGLEILGHSRNPVK